MEQAPFQIQICIKQDTQHMQLSELHDEWIWVLAEGLQACSKTSLQYTDYSVSDFL